MIFNKEFRQKGYGFPIARSLAETDRFNMVEDLGLPVVMVAADIYVKLCRDTETVEGGRPAQVSGLTTVLSSSNPDALQLDGVKGVTGIDSFDIAGAPKALPETMNGDTTAQR